MTTTRAPLGLVLGSLLVSSLLGPTTSLLTSSPRFAATTGHHHPATTPPRRSGHGGRARVNSPRTAMAAATTSTEAPVAPAPSFSATGEQGRFELRALDLRVASNEDVKEACDAFARGFYRPPSAEPVAVSDAALAPLATAKFEAIEERFMAESPGASSNAKDDAPRLPAVLLTVRDTSTQKLVGCCTVVGCVKVRDTSGSRLLSGREAESYIVEAQAEAKAMLESGRTKGREGKAPARQRRGAEGEGGANARAAEGRELGEAGGEGVPSVTKALATIAAGGLVRPRQVALLSDLTVLPEARRNGLAKRMCVECRQQSVGWGFEELILLVNEANGEARSLYRSNGFVEEGTKSPGFEEYAARSEGGGDVVMEKRAVTNLLMSQWLRGQPKQWKLGASNRAEEKLRKQWIGHAIPAFIAVGALLGRLDVAGMGGGV